MEIRIHIVCDNEAFSDGSGLEVSRILRKLSESLRSDIEPGDGEPLFDINGNRVGQAQVF